MRPLLYVSLLLAAGISAPVLARPLEQPGAPMTASGRSPDMASQAPGIPGEDAANPAPGAQGPYVGAGKQGFYDIDQRIAAMGQAIAALPPGQRRRAGSQLHAIRSEEAFKRAKYGELRDWDREHLTVMLDHLAGQYPGLRVSP